MGFIKKTVLGAIFAFLLFIIIQIFGADFFTAEFLSIGGLMIFLAMGAFEINFATYA